MSSEQSCCGWVHRRSTQPVCTLDRVFSERGASLLVIECARKPRNSIRAAAPTHARGLQRSPCAHGRQGPARSGRAASSPSRALSALGRGRGGAAVRRRRSRLGMRLEWLSGPPDRAISAEGGPGPLTRSGVRDQRTCNHHAGVSSAVPRREVACNKAACLLANSEAPQDPRIAAAAIELAESYQRGGPAAVALAGCRSCSSSVPEPSRPSTLDPINQRNACKSLGHMSA